LETKTTTSSVNTKTDLKKDEKTQQKPVVENHKLKSNLTGEEI